MLARTDYKEVPPRVDYALTPLGRSLADAIVPLCVHLGNREHGGNDKHLPPSATLSPSRMLKNRLSRTTLRIRGRAAGRILPIRPSGCAVWALWPMFCGSDLFRHP